MQVLPPFWDQSATPVSFKIGYTLEQRYKERQVACQSSLYLKSIHHFVGGRKAEHFTRVAI